MALARPLPPLWQALLPSLNRPFRPLPAPSFLQRLSQPFWPSSTAFGALAILLPPLPSIPSLADIWNGILNAVPKKKTSYRKKRQRFLVGKALKDVTALNTCSACGRVKRMHLLCPYCVDAIKTNIFGQLNWSVRRPTKKQAKQNARERLEDSKNNRTFVPDPREAKKDQILKHTGWKR